MAVATAAAPLEPIDLAGFGPVIPVIVIDRVDRAVPMARALVEGGVRVLEVTLRTAAAAEAARAAARWTRSSAGDSHGLSVPISPMIPIRTPDSPTPTVASVTSSVTSPM